METWTLLSESGDLDVPMDDPQQRIRPVLDGRSANIAWLPADGLVKSYPAADFEIKIHGDHGFETTTHVPGQALTIYVTDQRVVLLMPDVDPGSGLLGDFADIFSGGAAGFLREAARSASGNAGLREKYHLVAQIDYLCLGFVRYYQATIWGSRSLIDLGAVTGEPSRPIEIVATSVPRKSNVEGLARDIFTRVQAAQLREDLRPLMLTHVQALLNTGFKRSGDGYLASFGETAMPLTNLATMTAGPGAASI